MSAQNRVVQQFFQEAVSDKNRLSWLANEVATRGHISLQGNVKQQAATLATARGKEESDSDDFLDAFRKIVDQEMDY